MAIVNLNQQFLISGYIEDLTDNTSIPLNDNILSVAVKKDFSTDVMPLFVVNIKVDYATREILRLHDFRLAITVEEFDIKEDLSEDDYQDNIPTGTTFSTILKIFDKNIQPIDIKQDSENEEDYLTAQKFDLSFTCIPEDIYNRNSRIINSVYQNASNNEIIIDILSDDNIKLYIDPSNNTDREERLFIPPLNVSKAIEYLQIHYGIYDSHYNLFFDLDTTYLKKKYNDNSYIGNMLNINILSQNEISDSLGYYNMEYDNETGNLRKVLKTTPIFTEQTDVMSNLLGGHVFIGSYGENYELITRSYEDNQNDSKIRYFWNPSRNSLFETTQEKIPNIFINIPFYQLIPHRILDRNF